MRVDKIKCAGIAGGRRKLSGADAPMGIGKKANEIESRSKSPISYCRHGRAQDGGEANPGGVPRRAQYTKYKVRAWSTSDKEWICQLYINCIDLFYHGKSP